MVLTGSNTCKKTPFNKVLEPSKLGWIVLMPITIQNNSEYLPIIWGQIGEQMKATDLSCFEVWQDK